MPSFFICNFFICSFFICNILGTTTDVAIDIDSSTLDIDASGDITIDTTSNSATALTLTTNGGVNEKIVIMNTSGTNAAAIDINASAGGIDIDANGVLH